MTDTSRGVPQVPEKMAKSMVDGAASAAGHLDTSAVISDSPARPNEINKANGGTHAARDLDTCLHEMRAVMMKLGQLAQPAG